MTREDEELQEALSRIEQIDVQSIRIGMFNECIQMRNEGYSTDAITKWVNDVLDGCMAPRPEWTGGNDVHR